MDVEFIRSVQGTGTSVQDAVECYLQLIKFGASDGLKFVNLCVVGDNYQSSVDNNMMNFVHRKHVKGVVEAMKVKGFGVNESYSVVEISW